MEEQEFIADFEEIPIGVLKERHYIEKPVMERPVEPGSETDGESATKVLNKGKHPFDLIFEEVHISP